jgi:hypothetical protein
MYLGMMPLAENKRTGAQGWQPYHLYVPIALKPGSPNLLELSGPE